MVRVARGWWLVGVVLSAASCSGSGREFNEGASGSAGSAGDSGAFGAAGSKSGEGGSGDEPGAGGSAGTDGVTAPILVMPGAACDEAGDYGCSEAGTTIRLVCEGGIWTSTADCPSDTVCDTRAATLGECTPPLAGCTAPGDTFCNGQTPKQCNEDLLTAKSLPACVEQACRDGECTGDCAPGAGRCTEGGAEQCTEFGAWGTGVACLDQACVAGECQGVCSPTTTRCEGLVPQTCSDEGAWVAGEACDKVCQGGACSGTCAPNAKKCNGQVPQSCDASGTWQDGAACSNQACVDGACVGECSPQSKKCTGNGVQVCGADGEYGAATDCVSQACVSGACVGECEPGEKRCTDNSVETCSSNGVWGGASACTDKACVDGACVGSCTPGAKRCSADGNGVETCSNMGVWGAASKCNYPNHFCSSGTCTTNPSCAGPLANCGSSGSEGCCVSSLVTGGDFYRHYDGVNYTSTAYPATVADFRLDKFEVTVGRFRKFVAAWVGGWRPVAGSGKHAHLSSGAGLKAGAGNETGWQAAWNASLPASNAAWTTALTGFMYATWTNAAGANESKAIVSPTWYEAYAFCIWDGGFLPTEAEWNYAAAGGAEQRVYPWSSPPTSDTISSSYAVYYDNASHPVATVGTKSSGNGKWGQADMAGNASEWVMDQGNAIAASGGNPVVWPATPCDNCMTTSTGSQRGMRGGDHLSASYDIRTGRRWSNAEGGRLAGLGFRCAYEP